MGRGAREKYDIAVGFSQRAEGSGLKLDVEADEHRRIYGHDWYRFMANCRAVLGVEAGVSIFDVEDRVRQEYERLVVLNPKASFDDLSRMLDHWEGNIPYRTISPRHFEAAAFGACQILFEGSYSEIMQPMVHYIPLKKDFSNFDDVVLMFRDETLRRELTENAYRDLIASGTYTYRRFVEGFDEGLRQAGVQSDIAPETTDRVDNLLGAGRLQREFGARLLAVRHYPFPGRRFVRPLVKPILRRLSNTGTTGPPRINA
jgi:hypothetical protein